MILTNRLPAVFAACLLNCTAWNAPSADVGTAPSVGQTDGARRVSHRIESSPMNADLYPGVTAYLDARATEFDQISPERKDQLEQLASYIRRKSGAEAPTNLLFVCTHNSRRSHLSQLWAAASAARAGLRIQTYSGGTESTAFNPRAVAACQRAGIRIVQTTQAKNPVYHARISADLPAMTCFSKPYDNDPNPKDGFAAVMVCSDADEACPFVPGADFRIALPFADPKISDGTAEEADTYDERCAQIAREMLYVMTRAAL